jgi:hypothetical protein
MVKSKNTIIGVALAFFVSTLGLTVYVTQNKRLPDIFWYVPTEMDQVMVNWAEKNMKNNTNMLVTIPQAVKDQFQNIKVIIIAQDQTFSWEQLVFLETKTGFSPENFLTTINPEGETTSTYLRLGDGQYLFWPQEFIRSYQKPTPKQWLFFQAQLKKYLPTIRKSGMSILSHNKDLLPLAPQHTSLIDGSEYLLMNISSLPNGVFDFAAYIIFSEIKDIPSSVFKPQFNWLLNESTIAYLEIGKIFSWLDITVQQASWSLQELLFKKISANNFAVIISKWANMFNLGLTIVTDDKSLYDDLKPLIPLLKTNLENLPLLTGSQLVAIEQPWKIWYDITLQGIQKIWLYLEQTQDQTRITLGNPIIEGKQEKLRKYSKDALAVLYIDMNNLLDIYKQFSNIASNPSALQWQESLFEDMKNKLLRGEVIVQNDAVYIKGSIK